MNARSRWAIILGLAIAAIATIATIARRGDGDTEEVAPVPMSRGRARLVELRLLPPGSVEGRVTTGGRPTGGATVCARADRGTDPPACTTTTADGRYALRELAPGAYVVWASSARGGGRHPAELTVMPGRVLRDIDVVLAPGVAEVRGVVRDVRGHPIARATIHLGTDPRAPPVFTTHSDAGGAFVGWTPTGDVFASGSADGFVDGEARGVAPSTTLALELVPESTVEGIVIDARTREPLEGAEVEVGGIEVRTSSTGVFRARRLRPGRYKPTATTIGGYGEARESVLVSLGRSVGGVVIEIHPVAVVAGRIVVAGPSGDRPCEAEHGEVMLDRYGGRAAYFTRTGDDGDVLLEGVVPGVYAVTAGCRGALSRMPYPDLVVGDSDVDDVVWQVSPGATIRGSVRAHDGTPIAGATVNHRAASGGSWGTTVTLADGTFTGEGLAPGANELDVEADGFLRPKDHPTVMATLDRVATIDVVLERGGAIAGVVVDELGVPVAGATVDASGDAGNGTGTSDAAGRFTIDALDPGHYEVRVDGTWGRGVPVETDVIAHATAHVRVVANSPAGAITGVVVDRNGAPIPDVYVVAARADDEADRDAPPERRRGTWQTPGVLVGMDGRFRIPGLPRGTFSLRAYREDSSGTIVDGIPAGGHATIVIPPTGVIAGVVTSPDRAVDDLTLSAVDRSREITREEHLYHTGGRFVLRDLPAGRYVITVDDDPRSVTVVTLADGERREDLRLVVQPRFTLRGRLVSPAGAPLVGWTIETPRLSREDERPDGGHVTVSTIETAITGADGRFLVRDLPGGPVTVSAANLAADPEAKLAPIRELVLAGATDVDLGDVVARP